MSFVREITELLAANPSRIAITTVDEELTAGALLARAAVFRRALQGRGVRPGDHVALLASSTPDWVACDLAVLAEGATLVPLDPRQAEAERSKLIRDAKPTLLVVEDGFEGTATLALPTGAARMTLAQLASGGPAEWTPPRVMPPDTVATIIYTSGSSGEPKGVVLTRANMCFMVERTSRRLAELTGLPLGAERALHYLPLCYAGSRILLLSCLLRGARLHLLADPKQLGDALEPANADYFLNVPLVLERFQRAATGAVESRGIVPARILRRAVAAWERVESGEPGLRDRVILRVADRLLFSKIRARFGQRLKGVICGSAPLAPDTQRFFRMLGVDVYQGYGLTETTALCTLDVAGAIEPGRVGPALDGVEMKVSDEGEILTRGPHVFAGYWGRPEATADAFTDDGWFRTGDLGDVDRRGHWRITGRRSAVLVLQSGHNVAPEPLETALRLAIAAVEPSLTDAQIVVLGHGRPHAVALVGPSGEDRVSEATVHAALARLNPTLSPKGRIHRIALLPEALTPENGLLTANLKLRRKEIASRFAETIDPLYARESARV